MAAIYLDNNATTKTDPQVIAAMVEMLEVNYGNPASSTHTFGWFAAEKIKIAREQIASLINADPEEIIFTSGATEANNLAILGVTNNLEKKSHGISVPSEHRSVLDPFKNISSKLDCSYLNVKEDGSIDLNELEKTLNKDTALVSIMLANNEIGTIHPIKEIAKIVKKTKSIFHCDATQAIGKLTVDVKDLNVDLLSLSAHKFYGPKGCGALYIKKNSCKLSPLIFGGDHEKGLRSGTLNVASIVGMGEAAKIAKDEIIQHSDNLNKLCQIFLEELNKSNIKFTLNGPSKNRLPGNLNIAFEGIDNARLIGMIQTKIALSASSACQSASALPSHVLSALGFDLKRQKSSIRIGIGKYNSEIELIKAAEIISQSVKKCID